MEIQITKLESLPSCGDGCCHDKGYFIEIEGGDDIAFFPDNKHKQKSEIECLILFMVEHFKGFDHEYTVTINKDEK